MASKYEGREREEHTFNFSGDLECRELYLEGSKDTPHRKLEKHLLGISVSNTEEKIPGSKHNAGSVTIYTAEVVDV